jgi:hypothetical protein
MLPTTKPSNRIRLGLEANYLAGKPNNMSSITALVICDLLFWSFIAILLFSWRELSRGDKHQASERNEKTYDCNILTQGFSCETIAGSSALLADSASSLGGHGGEPGYSHD